MKKIVILIITTFIITGCVDVTEEIEIQGLDKLKNLKDVNVTPETENKILAFDEDTNKWKSEESKMANLIFATTTISSDTYQRMGEVLLNSTTGVSMPCKGIIKGLSTTANVTATAPNPANYEFTIEKSNDLALWVRSPLKNIIDANILGVQTDTNYLNSELWFFDQNSVLKIRVTENDQSGTPTITRVVTNLLINYECEDVTYYDG